MTSVVKALSDSTFQRAVWETFEIPMNISLPSLTNELLYGDLSASVHSPSLRHVYLSEETDSKNDFDFYTVIASRLRPPKTIDVYSEAKAEWAKKTQNQEMIQPP